MAIEKLLHIDTETTGTDEKIHDPHQIAVIIEIDKKIIHKEIFYMQPINWDTINPEALKVSRISIDTLKTYPLPTVTYARINHLFKKYVNPYDKQDKFIATGYNVRFDMRMMDSWYRKLHNDFFYSLVSSKVVHDVMEYISFFIKLSVLPPMENIKLATVCENLGIDIVTAHDAMCDIMATRTIYWRCEKIINIIRSMIKEAELVMTTGDDEKDEKI